MNIEPLLRRVDHFAGGRNGGYLVPDGVTRAPRVRRAFIVIAWLLVAEFALGLAVLVFAIVLQFQGHPVAWPVWMRTVVVLGITTTLFYFLWRAQRGFYWAYSRLRLFSKIFPVIALVLAAIPGLYPIWLITEQIVFALILIGISDYLSSDYMRAAFPKPSTARS